MATTSYSEQFLRAKDKIRLLIFDRKPPSWSATREYKYLFSDDELDAIYSLSGSCVWKSAAQCMRILAADAARRAISFDLLNQNLRLDRTLTPTALLRLAQEYEKRANSDIHIEIGQWTDGDDEWLKTTLNTTDYDMEDDYNS